VRLLEETVIAALSGYGIHGITTENPGVWVSEEEKIAAVGVHVQRRITSHGVAINVQTDLEWFDRIVACGLEGKKTTSMERILTERGHEVPDVKEVAMKWVDAFALKLGFDVEAGAVRRFDDSRRFLNRRQLSDDLVKKAPPREVFESLIRTVGSLKDTKNFSQSGILTKVIF